MIESDNSEISIRKQCKLIGLSRASFYYHPAQESEENLKLMRLIDEKYIIRPFYGSRKMTLWLQEQGYCVNRKRVQRLMQLIGIEAIYPKPRTTVAHPEHKIYPYLLRGLVIEHPDQVWCTDITYIPMRYGFMYLMAIMDWYSRYVITWQLSNTLDSDFCVDALEEALSGKKPEIFNSDQGSQFTSLAFTGCLKKAEVKISMDGRGRVADNIFIERMWRTLKYEDIYIKEYDTIEQLYKGLTDYFQFYNWERPHQGLGYRTPSEVYLK